MSALDDKVKAMSAAERRAMWNKFFKPMMERAGIQLREEKHEDGDVYVMLHFPEGEPDVFKRYKDALETE